jgi:hypothetical protein
MNMLTLFPETRIIFMTRPKSFPEKNGIHNPRSLSLRPMGSLVAFLFLSFLTACSPEPASPSKKSQTGKSQPEIPVRASSLQKEVFSDLAPLALLPGQAEALPIIVAEDAPPHTRSSAFYLADTIEKISGTRPEVLENLPTPLPEQAIWVGYQPAMDALFPGVDFTFNHPEEIVLAANENHLAITGRDRWDPKYPEVMGRRFPITEKQQEYGSANAVFTFLQDIVGVRWLFPGELGTDYPAAESLNITPFTLRYHPQFRGRVGLFNQLERGYIQDDERQEWSKHQRLLLDSLPIQGGHPFVDWWEKYGESQPELFALQPDGTRGTFPEDPRRRKLCEGEPAVWQTWLDEQAELFASYPHREILKVAANDSYFSGHCTDPRSRAWDPDPSETDVRVRLSWADGVSEEWPPLSDRYVHFANKLSELAEERFPDRDFWVMMNSYGEVGCPAPVNAKPRDNVIVISVHNFIMRHAAMREEPKKQFKEWAEITSQIIWRPNIGNQGGVQTGFPDVPFQQAMEDMRFVAEHGAIGIFFDTLFEHWATNAPFFYLLSQLAWDPYADGNAILADYYRHCYGPAAGPMQEYWELMEKTRQAMVETIANRRTAFLHTPAFFTEEVLAEAESLLARAENLAQGAPEKYAQRVNFTRAGLNHVKSLVAMRALMNQAEDHPGEREALHAQALEKWDEWETMVEAFPPYAINTNRLGFIVSTRKNEPNRTNYQGNTRISGYHPLSPLTRRQAAAMKEDGLDLN